MVLNRGIGVQGSCGCDSIGVCCLDESGTECHREVVSGRRSTGTIRSLVNYSGLQLQCARALDEILLEPVLIYGSETQI